MTSAAETARRHVRARLRRIAVDYRAMNTAIEAAFGVDFDPAEWARSFESEEPAEVNRVAPVLSAFERIVNGLVETARAGLIAGAIEPPGRTPQTVRSDLVIVQRDGGLTRGQLTLLVALNRTRNELQHAYIEVSASDARAAVIKLRRNVGAFTKSLNRWLGRYDVGV